MTGPKVLTLDIETLPLESYTWGTWRQDVGLNQIKEEWSIASYAAKWLGKRNVIYASTGGRGAAKVRDDKALLAQLHALLDETDVVVAQNGIKFDLRKINARMLMHGMAPYSPVRVVDTCRVARRYFGLTSNKLEWMSTHLTDTPKHQHKRFPGFELWRECLKDNPEAWAQMRTYNIRDVVATEKVYRAQLPWIQDHPNTGLYADGEEPCCPNCGSKKVQRRGTATSRVGVYPRHHCLACGAWSRGKAQLLGTEKRAALLR